MALARNIVCDSFWRRFLGSAKMGLHCGDVLTFPNTRVVHTCFGRLPRRILFLSGSGLVLKEIESPRRFRVFGCMQAFSVREEL
ncbi:MAG: hypothetical protein RL133_1326 [Pseudomonadota bacterium]